MERWLETVEESGVRARIQGDEPLARLLAGEGGDAGIPPGVLAPALSWSGDSLREAPDEVQEILLREQMAVPLDAKTERLRSLVLRVYAVSLVRIHYRLCGQSGSVDIQSWDDQICENSRSTEPLRRRLRWMKASASSAAILGAALAVWFGVRHPFYLASLHLLALGGLAALLAISVLPLVALMVLPRGAIRSGRLTATALPSAFVLTAQFVLAATGGPSLEHAQKLALAGDTQEARFEAAACADLNISGRDARVLHDRLQVDQVRTIRKPEEAWKATEMPFYTQEGRHRAQEHALSMSLQEVAGRQAGGDFETAKALLLQIPPFYKEDPRVRKLWFHDDMYRAQSLWTTIRSLEPLEVRLRACEEIHPFLEGLKGTDGPEWSITRIESRCASLNRDWLREMARREREIEREQEAEKRERRRALRAAEAAAQAWSNAPLLCRDGSLSPSCLCGRGSYSGCCSHHGGVAGCSKP